MIFAGVDWAEAHHDVCVMNADGQILGRARVAHSVAGIGELHALIAAHAGDGEPVAVAIEIDRGLIVTALRAAGYQVYAVNPLASARYRELHAVSGAKSDRGDARMLADLARTGRSDQRLLAGDSDLADAVRVLARAHSPRSGPGSGRSMRCGQRCGSTTRPRWQRSAPTWPAVTRSRC